MTRALAVLAALTIAGCSQTNIADLVTAMGKDPASVCVHIAPGLYTPAMTITRVVGPNIAAQCDQGAITTVPTPLAGVATVTVPVRIQAAP